MLELYPLSFISADARAVIIVIAVTAVTITVSAIFGEW